MGAGLGCSVLPDRALASCSLAMSCQQALLEEKEQTQAALARAEEQTTLCSSLQQSLQVPAHPCPCPLHLLLYTLLGVLGTQGSLHAFSLPLAAFPVHVYVCSAACAKLIHANRHTSPPCCVCNQPIQN